MTSLLKKLEWRLRGGHRRTSHPRVKGSWISDFSLIDPSATVSNSRLYLQIKVGPEALLEQCNMLGTSPIEIGAYSALSGPIIVMADLNPVTIGKFCSFAPQVVIWESLHHTDRISSHFMMSRVFGDEERRDLTSRGPIEIGNDVWVGTGAKVLSGVRIGHGAVIGAGSVVTKDIAPYTIAAGSPAVPLRARFSDEIAARLLDLRWWDWDMQKIRRNRSLFADELVPAMLDNIV